MKSMLSLISYLCGMISGFVVFFMFIYIFQMVDRATHHHYSGICTAFTVIFGLVFGIAVSDFIKNLIYREPTRFT